MPYMKKIEVVCVLFIHLFLSCTNVNERDIKLMHLNGDVVKIETVSLTSVPIMEMSMNNNPKRCIAVAEGNYILTFNRRGNIIRYQGFGIDNEELFDVSPIRGKKIIAPVSIGNISISNNPDSVHFEQNEDGELVVIELFKNNKLSNRIHIFYDQFHRPIMYVNDKSFVGSDILINFTIKSAITGEFFNDASGELRVYVGSKFYVINVTDGRANLTVSDLSISSYNVVAIYSGDQNYAGCDGYSKFEVKGYETSLIITLGSDEILVDKSLKVTVSVNETINNAPIYLYVDGVLYNILLTKDGISVFNVTGLKAGVHNIEAVFPSTSAFGNVSNKTSVSVIKNNPNFSAEAIANSTNDVFIRFILPDDATGVINVTYGGALIKSVVVDANRTINLGKYSIMGNYTFDIVYSGDEKYFNVSSSSTVEVGKISDYVMNITSTVVVRNKDVTIFVNLPSEFMNNGTVNLTINGNYEVLSLVNSQVNKTIATTGLGEINVVAVYSGFDMYASKTVSKVFEFKPTDEYDIRIIVDDVE